MEPTEILMMNYNLFNKMKELAEKQEKVIVDDQLDEFNNLMNQREHLRKEITSNSQLYNTEIKTNANKRGAQNIKNISTKISDIIRSIQETDKRIEEFVCEKKDLLLNDMKNIKKGQQAVKRYGGASNKINKFLNKNG
jgi:hypothetical protein